MTEKTASVPAAGQPANPWLFGPVVDLLIGCGAWSLPLLFLGYQLGKGGEAWMALGFYGLAMFCNNPHYMATVYRAYRTPQDFRKYRFFTLHVTLFMLLVMLVLYVQPAWLPAVFTLYFLWSPWHYTGQNFGIAMMMARRNGVQPEAFDRNLIYTSYLSSYLLWVLHINVGDTNDVHLLSLQIPLAVAKPVMLGLILLSTGAGAWGLWGFIRQVGGRRMLAPVALFVTQLLWFVTPVVLQVYTRFKISPLYYSTGMLAFMHCAQYLWVTSYYVRREAQQTEPSRVWSFRRYYFALVVGGIALFIPGPWVASWIFRQDLAEGLLIFIALVNIHHFILDGAIWKLRDGRIARLLVGGTERPAEPGEEEQVAFGPFLGWAFGKSRSAQTCRIILVGTVLVVGLADQYQYYLTREKTTLSNLQTAEGVNGRDSRVFYQRAKILAQQGNSEKAMEAVNRAVALNAYSFPPQFMKGQLLAQEGKVSEAYGQFRLMASLFKPMPEILVNGAVFAVHAGHPDEAVVSYEKAVQRDPGNPNLRLALGEACQSARQYEKAILHYAGFIAQLDPDDRTPETLRKLLRVQMKMGECCLRLRLPEKAVDWYRAASIQAKAIGEPDLAAECYGRLGELFEWQKKTEEAEAALAEAVRATAVLSEASPAGQHRLGESWLAYAWFQFENERDPASALASARLADNIFAADQTAEWRERSRELVLKLTQTLGPKATLVEAQLAEFQDSFFRRQSWDFKEKK